MVVAFYGIRHGVGLRSKLKMVALSMLSVVPWETRMRHPRLDRVVDALTPGFSDVVVEKDGLMYQLVDHESLYIVVFHEDWMERYLEIGEGDVFVDIGAHVGKYTIPASRKASRVIAIEADPENYRTLVHNIGLNDADNVDAVNEAAWNKEETLRFHLGDFSGHGSLKEGLTDRSYSDTIRVQAEATDAMLRRHEVARVDWVKIDVEGAELEVLRGLEETLSTHRARLVVELMKPNVAQALAYMKGMGYDATPIPESESSHQIYILFTPNDEAEDTATDRTPVTDGDAARW
jgi:FkbM family methyltransferase